jgi:hypothetical protein
MKLKKTLMDINLLKVLKKKKKMIMQPLEQLPLLEKILPKKILIKL